jgi:glycosyltransferase involved in cell wall biosynthesis
MKVLFLTRLFWPHTGGIEKHIDEVSKILVKRGHKVTILTTKYNKSLRTREPVRGYKAIRFNQPKIKYLGIFYTWYWLLRNINLIKQSDIVHIHDVFIWYWPLKLLLPFNNIYLTIHGRWGKYPIPWKDKVQKQIAAKFSNGTISIGEYINKNYGIKSDIISYGAAETPKKPSTKNNKTILYVGRLDNDIALNKYFKVFRKLTKDYKITFCGDGDLKKEAEKCGKVLGWTNPNPYYKKAKYVFASGYLTILEAMINKCLVFTLYENPLHKDYYKLTPFKNYIISVSSETQLYNQFNYYQNNIKEANKLISNGYRWVKNQTWQKMTDNYTKLWQRK